MSKKPYKAWRCMAHLPRPGFAYGSQACACLRKVEHPGPHRACGRWEWDNGARTCKDILTGRIYDL